MFYSKTSISYRTRCVCETKNTVLLIKANLKDDQIHKDKCLDTSRKTLSQECSCEISKL